MSDENPTQGAPKRGVSRRNFLRGSLLGAATGLFAQGCATPAVEHHTKTPTNPPLPTEAEPKSFDFRTSSASMGNDTTTRSACQFCNSLCGLDVSTRKGRVVEIRGLDSDPVQAGGLCVKADLMAQLVHNGHRLKQPLRRVSGEKGDRSSQFKEISWDEALTEIAKTFLSLRDAGQAHTITNRTTGRMLRGADAVIGRFFSLLGSPNNTDVGPVCNDAGGNALAWTFGLGNFTNGYGVDPSTGREDLGSAQCFFFLGTNQAETHPVTFSHLLRHRERTQAPLIVADPRKTPTAAHADLWLPLKPHTDMALVLGMAHTILEENLVDRAFLDAWSVGHEAFFKHLRTHQYTAAWAASVCDLPERDIRRAARLFAQAKPAAIFCNAGISHQLSAFDTYRTLAFLSSMTGNVGVPGGGCNFMHNTWPGGMNLPPLQHTPPTIQHPALPVGPDSFASSILTAQPYALRAVVTQGNPLLSSANTKRVHEAFKALDFYVYTGLFMEEAAYYADIILPVRSGLETEGVYMRRDDRAVRWQNAAVPPVGTSKTDVQIWIELAHTMARLDSKHPAEYWTRNIPRAWEHYATLWDEFNARTPGMGGMASARMKTRDEPLRWPCPSEDHPGVSTLYRDDPSWYDVVASLKPSHKGKRFLTPSGKVEFTTPELEKKLSSAGHSALPTFYTHPEVTGQNPTIRYTKKLVSNPIHPRALTPHVVLGEPSKPAERAQFPLMGMIGRSSVVHFAGATHWTYSGKQLDGVRLIQLHPKTAKARGIRDGDEIVVSSPRGEVRGTALLWKEIRRDTIFVPNGFGFAQKVAEMAGAPRYEPANILLDDQFFDNLSGQQAYKCFACQVRKA